MEPMREHLRVERVREWLSGVGNPSFAAKCVSPWSGHIFLGLSFLSSKIKGLQGLSTQISHDSNLRGSSSLFITIANCLLPPNPPWCSYFLQLPQNRWNRNKLKVSDSWNKELVFRHLGGETCIWSSFLSPLYFLFFFFPFSFSLFLCISLSLFSIYLRNRQNTIWN